MTVLEVVDVFVRGVAVAWVVACFAVGARYAWREVTGR